ncbi:MAG: sigma 54-interacting transcriptional regulator [Candidatus Eisenbacteria bacterium]
MHYDEVWPKAMALVPKGDIVAELRRRRAECYLLLGRPDEAYAAAVDGLAHCRELGDRYEEAATYRVLALSAAAVGKADEARQHFIQGFAYYEDIETPYEWGKLWMAYGDWLSGPNSGTHTDRANAREAYLAARDHFSNMGARAKLREAEARLAALDPPTVEGTVEFGATNGLGLAETDSASTSATAFAQGPSSIIRRAPRRPTTKSALDLRSDAAWKDWYLVTRYEPLLNMLDRATKLAKSEVSILITGETGTGKELIAAGMHRFSGLTGAYVPLNCAAVPKEMIESELFGHVRGAFSGAVVERAGLVEMAAKGTLFLDEVGEMSEAMQAKLLRFLESGEYRRVGESANRHVKARLIAATNISRDDLAKGDGFRGDLYWRLGQSFLDVAPLRHRKGDVALLIEHFLRIEASKMGKPSITIDEAAMAQLESYAWPGNVRELIGVMRRAVALAERTIEPEHLDLSPARDMAVTHTEEMAAAERLKLARAMKEHNNSPTLAAKALGIPRTTLVMKLKRYGMR